MRRSAIHAGILLIVVVLLAAPVSELFDSWDNTLQSGNDIESSLAIVAVCLGAALVVAEILSKLARNFAINGNAVIPQPHFPCLIPSTATAFSSSPPNLRI